MLESDSEETLIGLLEGPLASTCHGEIIRAGSGAKGSVFGMLEIIFVTGHITRDGQE